MDFIASQRMAAAAFTLFLLAGCAGLEPTAKVTSSQGPDIQQATQEAYDGPKARVAVSKFVVKAPKAIGTVGDGVADMLATALFNSNRYIVLERQALADVLAEQDLGASGRVRQETAARIGQIEGAELLVMGTVTEFEPGNAGIDASTGAQMGTQAGCAAGVWGCVVGGLVGAFAGSYRSSHLAIDLRIIDARTSRVIGATSVQGQATDIAGLGSIAGPSLGVGLSGYARTPMELALRIAIQEGVKFVVSKTPAQYYRYSDAAQAVSPPPMPVVPAAQSQTSPAAPPLSSAATAPGMSAATSTPPVVRPPASDTMPIFYIKTQFANLREAPGDKSKIVGVLKRGTKLSVVDGKNDWYRVKLDDGREGWVAGSVTALQPE